jgi:hypothetical protein
LSWVATAAKVDKKYDPGVSDTEINFGQSLMYSGPYSVYRQIGKAELAYFAKLNAEGGIDGRNIRLVSLDAGYLPPRRSAEAPAWRRKRGSMPGTFWRTTRRPRSRFSGSTTSTGAAI